MRSQPQQPARFMSRSYSTIGVQRGLEHQRKASGSRCSEQLAHKVQCAVGSPFGSPQYSQHRTPVRGWCDLRALRRGRSSAGGAQRGQMSKTSDCRRAGRRNSCTDLDTNNEKYPFTCAPTATRTRDLLLRRHFRSMVRRCRVSPDVPFSCSRNGWKWPGVARYLSSLAPSLAPRSRQQRRCSKADTRCGYGIAEYPSDPALRCLRTAVTIMPQWAASGPHAR